MSIAPVSAAEILRAKRRKLPSHDDLVKAAESAPWFDEIIREIVSIAKAQYAASKMTKFDVTYKLFENGSFAMQAFTFRRVLTNDVGFKFKHVVAALRQRPEFCDYVVTTKYYGEYCDLQFFLVHLEFRMEVLLSHPRMCEDVARRVWSFLKHT